MGLLVNLAKSEGSTGTMMPMEIMSISTAIMMKRIAAGRSRPTTAGGGRILKRAAGGRLPPT